MKKTERRSRLNDLHDSSNITLMNEYDPSNPYGPNYYMFSREM